MSQAPGDDNDEEQPPEDEQPADGSEGDGEGEGDGETEEDTSQSTGTVGSPNQYEVDDEVVQVGGDPNATIADVTVPGVYEVTQSGGGRKSQFLRETQANTNGDDPYGLNEGDQQNDDSNSEESSGGGEETPPLELDIRAHMGQNTYGLLEGLRETPANEETFSVNVGRVSLEDCELVDLQRTLSGETSFAYDVRIQVREYREYEVVDNTVQYDQSNSNNNSSNNSNDTSSSRGDGEFSTPVREWTDQNGDGVIDESDIPEGESLPEVETVQNLNENISGGEAIENLRVEGEAFIRASGDGWAIRNIGIDGVTQARPILHVDGNGIIENVYMDGEAAGRGGAGAGAIGIKTRPEHADHILIRFVHVRNMGDDGMYISAQGNPQEHAAPGSGGTTAVESCYAENNHGSSYRLGTDGSYVRDSVSLNEPNVSMWGYYEHTEAINCDFTDGIGAGGSAYGKQANAEVTIENCRVNGQLDRDDRGHVTGESVGEPDTTPPDNVPMSADEAAQGRFYSEPPG